MKFIFTIFLSCILFYGVAQAYSPEYIENAQFDNTSKSIKTSDANYVNKVSTGSYGKSLTTGTISASGYSVTDYSISVVGGDASFSTSNEGGILYLNSTIPTFTKEYKVPKSSWNLTIRSLTSGATVYYSFGGVQ